MVRPENWNIPHVEPQEKISSAEVFLAKLFDELSKVLIPDQQQKIFDIPQHIIKDWDYHDEDVKPGSNPLSNNIIGGFILRTKGIDLAIVLGERQRRKGSDSVLSLQFGAEPNGGIDKNIENPTEKAKDILNKKTPKIAGDFFKDPEKGVVLDFYPGGQDSEAKKIRDLKQEQLLTREGLTLSIIMVQSLLKSNAPQENNL